MSIIQALFVEPFYCTCFSFSSKNKCIDLWESIFCVLLYFNFQGKQQRVRGIARSQEWKGASLLGRQHQPLGFFQEAESHPSCAFDFKWFSDLLKRHTNNSLLLLWHIIFDVIICFIYFESFISFCKCLYIIWI